MLQLLHKLFPERDLQTGLDFDKESWVHHKDFAERQRRDRAEHWAEVKADSDVGWDYEQFDICVEVGQW
jgi:hypothetical protein